MTFLLMCIISFAANTLNYSSYETLNAATIVLLNNGFSFEEMGEYELVTEKTEIDINILDKYISENQFDENHGWTKARFHLKVRICEINGGQARIEINAHIERFGVHSAIMLIPPEWISVSSNGVLEKEILEEIEKELTVLKRRAQ